MHHNHRRSVKKQNFSHDSLHYKQTCVVSSNKSCTAWQVSINHTYDITSHTFTPLAGFVITFSNLYSAATFSIWDIAMKHILKNRKLITARPKLTWAKLEKPYLICKVNFLQTLRVKCTTFFHHWFTSNKHRR